MSEIKILVFVSALGLAIFSPISWSAGNFIQLSQQQFDNIGIKLGKLEPANHIPLFIAPAKVVVPPANDFVVSTSQAGLVVKMNASVGDKVAKGELLGLVSSPDLLTLQGNYLKAVGALKLTSATYNRDKKLRKEGVISGRNEQEAFSLYNASVIDVNEAKQLLQFAGMTADDVKQLDSTGRLVSQISVKSPIAGRVIERMVVSGTRVDAMAPLYRVANLDELWLEINIPQEHISDIKIGDQVQVENARAEAVIKVLGQSVNPENQTILARAVINGSQSKDSQSSVRVGQKVNIQLIQTTDVETYKLPGAAIANNDGKTYVFIRDKDGFKVSQVTILGKQSDGSVITGNFSGNEDVAINNAAALKAVWLGLGSDE
ncbi:MAG: HlyD family efflux transporter periplasmic adaptor subunit [Methyloglobulus sp.]|nr:HlyD family efflux transporter periplasmic adaptor subunit [Methyloglobulus sp.]